MRSTCCDCSQQWCSGHNLYFNLNSIIQLPFIYLFKTEYIRDTLNTASNHVNSPLLPTPLSFSNIQKIFVFVFNDRYSISFQKTQNCLSKQNLFSHFDRYYSISILFLCRSDFHRKIEFPWSCWWCIGMRELKYLK